VLAELDFLDLTSKSLINYAELADHMKHVFREFKVILNKKNFTAKESRPAEE